MNSFWQIWLHPRRAAMQLEEERRRRAEADTRVAAAEAARIALERRERELLTLLSERETSLAALREQCDTLEQRLAETQVELQSRQSAEEQMREFDEWIARVERMKEGYEEKIAGLRAYIAELERRIDASHPSDIAAIDMRGSLPGASALSEADWLDPLPEK